MITTAERLAELGFKGLSEQLKVAKERKRKLALAYEHYRFVRQEHIDAFNAKLKEKTRKGKGPYDSSWQELKMTPIDQYDKVPPENVLDSLQKAQEHKIFDRYEVAHIVNVKDPILFGRIAGCPDRFFIDQWDQDVTIKDLLKDNEG